MTAGGRRLSWILAAATVLCAGLAVAAIQHGRGRGDSLRSGQTLGEKVVMIKAERARLQARAGAEARIGLLAAFRVAGLLTDALAARADVDGERTLDGLPAGRRQAFADVDALNAALGEALVQPGEGSRLAARQAAEPAQGSLERLAGVDDLPLVLQFTPR